MAVQMLIWRMPSLLMTGASMSVLFQATGKRDDLEHCAGLLYRRPLNILTLVIGLLSLAGFPLTPGAIARWPLVLDLMASNPSMAWVLILAGAGIGIGTLGGLRACIVHPQTAPEQKNMTDRAHESVGMLFGLLTLWLVSWLFLRSALWNDILQRVLSEFTFLPG
jgi:formate hydrogenlyase subunit 3/multisubunit Na+/H+ antiporter MnhD subunit